MGMGMRSLVSESGHWPRGYGSSGWPLLDDKDQKLELASRGRTLNGLTIRYSLDSGDVRFKLP